MSIDQSANAHYRRLTLRIYAILNAVTLVVLCASLWFFAARANNHGIAPSTSLGFRSQHTLASLHGWYVAQRVGFHFAAIADTAVTVVVLAITAVAYVRRWKARWILAVPVVGGVALGVCLMIAGHKADQAATSVQPAAALQAEHP